MCGLKELFRDGRLSNHRIFRKLNRSIANNRANIRLLSRHVLHLNVRVVRIRLDGPSLGSDSSKDLEDIVHAQQPVVVDGEAGNANFLFGLCGKIAHKLEEAQFCHCPDVAVESGHGLFVGVQQDEVPVFEA
jgi:hypothetical protein